MTPTIIDPKSVTSDFHVHTALSRDARSALEDVVAAAVARGCKVLAITEHAEGLPISGVGRAPLLEQRAAIAALQAKLGDTIRLLHGIELNIGKDGELDYDAEFRAGFDFCLASIHDHFDLDVMRAGRGRKDVRFVLTSDAHQASELDRVGFAAMHASKAWLDPAQVVSTWSPERVLGWVDEKRAHGKA